MLFNDEPQQDPTEDSNALFDHKSKTVIEISRPVVKTVDDERFSLVLERWRKSQIGLKLENHRLPKTLLLQNCQKMNLSNPKFDRVQGCGINVQSVSINIPQGKKKSADLASGRHEFVFPFEFEPASVQEGQNCVAIIALMKLFPHLRLEMILQQPYKDIYHQIQQHSSL